MRSLVLFFLFLLVFVSCRKDPSTVPSGNVSVTIRVKHHQAPISGARVFMKRNADQFPGIDTTRYDVRQVCDASGYTRFDNIGNGSQQLYFYVKGVDPAWDSSGTTPVWGYNGISLYSAPGTDKDTSFVIYVSE